MDILQRLLRILNYNIVLYAVAAIAMLYVVTSRPVIDAVLSFCLAGIVPFSNHVIEPDVMYMGSIVALGLFIVCLLIWWLVSRARARQLVPAVSYNVSPARPVRAKTSATKVTSTKKYQATATPKLGRRASTTAVDYDIFDKTLVAIGNGWIRVGALLRSLALGVTNLIILLVSGIIIGLFKLAVAVYAAANALATELAPACRALLSWLQPRANRLDSWLEIKCKTFLQWSMKKLMRYERMQILAIIIRDGKITLRHLFK